MIYAVYAFFVLALVLLILSFTQPEEKIELPPELSYIVPKKSSLLRRNIFVFRPFAPINRFLLRRFHLYNLLERKIILTGLNTLPEDFMTASEILSFLFVLVVYLFKGSFSSLWVVGAAVAGFVLPHLYLSRRIAQRRLEILRAFPHTLSLIHLCVEAGLDLVMSLRWIVDRSKASPLMREFSLVLHEIEMGRPRREALRDMAKRIDLPEINSFVRSVVQAEKMGTSLSDALAMYSEEARDRMFERAERQALKAPLKMLIPLIFFILPVVAIIVAGPIIIRFIKTGLPGV